MTHRILLFLLCIAITSFISPAFGEYTPPTKNQLDEVLANPSLYVAVLEGANGKEASEVLDRIITIILESKLGPLQQNYQVAYWTARTNELLPEKELAVFSEQTAAYPKRDILPIIYAGMSLGGAGNSEFIDQIQTLAGENSDLQNAIVRPETVLTPPVYNLLVANISSGQTLPPPPNITTPIIPPGVAGQNSPPPPAPPVPAPYSGQGG